MPTTTLEAPNHVLASEVTLTDRVHQALATSPYVAGRRVRIEAEEGSVRLHGRVESFFEKQMAQEVVRRLDGVCRVENLLEVAWIIA